jgi:serine/threonine protein kinase
LPGFSHIHVLGSGGFADVFLYEQNMPRRQVAVKVMLAEVVNDRVRQQFQAEANVMAQLSSHPSILTVYQAGVSSDGRPYLVMELCSSALSHRYRAERLPVAEVLRIAVKIGGAIETAHRTSMLHRDIKPSNILMTAYGNPVLSDFGIAASMSESGRDEIAGLSIPWSAPEVLLDETSGTIRSEVWSFAATVYSLLAGRSPFEIPGGSNEPRELMARIAKARPQPLDRGDVPASLERVLFRAMSRKPDQRQGSVIEVVRELQSVETELGLQQTPVEVVVEDWARSTVSDQEDRTRIRGVAVASPSVEQRRARRRSYSGATPAGTMLQELPPSSRSTTPGRSEPARGLRALAWVLVGAAALVVGLGVVATVAIVQATSTGIPTVSDIRAKIVANTVEFSWADPGIGATDSYRIQTNDGRSPVQQRDSTFVVDAQPGEHVCVTVTVNRDGKSGETSAEKCADFPT